MFERAALVHYHEIGLKGRNRAAFERRLAANLTAAVEGLTDGRVTRIASRLIVPVSHSRRAGDVLAAIARIPGVAHVSDAYVTAREPVEMERAALLAVRDADEFETFAIEARRSATDYPETSQAMNVRIGEMVRRETGKRVDLTRPDVTLWVEVVQGAAYVATRRMHGPGGLPVGVSGKVVALLSAGIDSPVACWRMLKRGAVVVAVHFSGVPHTNDLSVRLVHEIAESLEPALGLARVYTVPFGDLQKEISLLAPPDLRVVLYRRLMLRVAERIAAFEGAEALVTGESLGQVASQTLENIAAVDAVAAIPVLRPLIGMDKLEIIATARVIGTYELSTQQHADCCTLFMPRTPHTHATVAECEAGEADLDIERMVADALAGMTQRDFRCPAYKPPKGQHA
ncbi:MAG: tRNA 4-thiouridine(8) synthase ThiI [Coriobacteriaceae bacterium]|nr:tRNA 4-thiouridine(8) synthase ThiI [Coriobacteriaceae bacterium]